jgi:hypothetical protein
MDHQQRSMARARAEWRAKRAGKTSGSLWGFENWGDERTQEHHPGRRKFSMEETVTIPDAMHPELTRRGEEEHTPLGLMRATGLSDWAACFLDGRTCSKPWRMHAAGSAKACWLQSMPDTQRSAPSLFQRGCSGGLRASHNIWRPPWTG